MVQKIISLLLVLLLSAMNTGNAQATSNANNILLQNAKQELMKEAKGQSYIMQISEILPMLDTQKLKSVRLNILAAKTNTTLINKHGALMKYLEYAIAQELENRKDDIQKIHISEVEQQEISKEILQMQQSLKKEGEKIFQTIMQEFKEISHVKQDGDLEINGELNAGDLGKASLDLKLSDYKSVSHNMDYRLSGDLAISLDSELAEANGTASLGAYIDLIYSQGSDYLKLKNLKMYAEGFGMQQEEIDTLLSELNAKLIQDNYIKLNSSEQTETMLEFLGNLSKTDHAELLDEVFEKSFFEAYEKNSDGSYTLRPTKNLCDGLKKLKQVFDPFHGKNCSESQYSQMLKDYKELGAEITYTSGNEKKITFRMLDNSTQYYSEVLWDTEGLTKLHVQSSDMWMGDIELNFVPEQKLSFDYKNEMQELSANIHGKLSSKGTIIKLSAQASMGEYVNMQVLYVKEKLDIELMAKIPDLLSLSCAASGPLEPDLGDIKYNCSLGYNTSFLAFFYGIDIDPSLDEIELKGTFTYDTRNGKNNLGFDFDATLSEDYYLRYVIKNTGNIKTIPEISMPIVTPSNNIEIENLLEYK